MKVSNPALFTICVRNLFGSAFLILKRDRLLLLVKSYSALGPGDKLSVMQESTEIWKKHGIVKSVNGSSMKVLCSKTTQPCEKNCKIL